MVAITSMSRPFASPGQKVVVHGTVTNTGRAALSGVTVQLLSSATQFTAPEQLQTYAAGKNPSAVGFEARALDKIRGTLAPGVTTHWTAVLPVNEVGMTVFGVYPLAAQATDSLGAVLGTSWSFLPFWPSAKSKLRPQRDDVAWIWPLIDTPNQGPCPDLLNNHLASSLASGGRLARLLSAGSRVGRAGGQADLGDRPRAAVQRGDHGGRAAQVALPGRRQAGLRAGQVLPREQRGAELAGPAEYGRPNPARVHDSLCRRGYRRADQRQSGRRPPSGVTRTGAPRRRRSSDPRSCRPARADQVQRA